MSWSTIVDNLKSELASGSLMTEEIEVEGVRHVFRSLDDIARFLAKVEEKAAVEAGTSINRPQGRVIWRAGR